MVLLEGREAEVSLGIATPLPIMAAALPDPWDLFFRGEDATLLVEEGAEATEVSGGTWNEGRELHNVS